jgi:hypothetical protein
MSWLRTLTAFQVAITAFVVGGVASNYAWQLRTLSQAADSAPAPTKVASFTTSGPGTAVHLELTDFKFGEPLIEKNGERWECVWLPLLSSSVNTFTPVVFFRSTRIRDQAQIDQLREQKNLHVFVINTSLKRSVWGAAVSSELFSKYEKLDFDKVTLVAEPDLEFPFSRELAGRPLILATPVLLAPMNRNIAWAVGGGSYLLGTMLVVLMISPNHRATVTELDCKVTKSDSGTGVSTRYLSSIPARFARPEQVQREREHLLNEQELSSHCYRSYGTVTAVFGVGLGLLLFLGAAGGLSYASSRAGSPGPAIAGGIGLMAACVFMFLVYFCKRSLDHNGKSVDAIQLCHSGIRWQVGKHVRLAAWTEIALVERVTLDVNRKKQVLATQFGLVGALAASFGNAGSPEDLSRERDTVALHLHTGDVMFFSMNSLSDYVTFARTLHELHGNEARRILGGGDGETLKQGVMFRGTPSRFTMLNYDPGRSPPRGK